MTRDPRWSWDSVLPVFRKSEHFHGEASAFHGSGGEWRVERQQLRWQVLESFREAVQQTALPATDDFNRGDNGGVGYFDVNQRRGWRCSASSAFLRPVRHRTNLTVITGVGARRLMFVDRRCTGIEFSSDGETQVARAGREVLLATGAVNTPQLLELSGVGDGERTQRLGISSVYHAPGVGQNLPDHLQLRMTFRVTGVATLNTVSAHWWGKRMIGLQYALTRTGPIAMSPSQLGVFAKSDPSDRTIARPDLEYHVQPLSLDRFGAPLDRDDAITAAACTLRPTSRGSTYIESPDPPMAPVIAPHLLSTTHDRHVAAPALARYRPEELTPGIQYQTEQELADAAGIIGTTIFHPVGTCRMGVPEDPSSVVDSELRVIGLDGLRVVDASVMPSITSGNTNSPTLMIAERPAELIRSARGGQSTGGRQRPN